MTAKPIPPCTVADSPRTVETEHSETVFEGAIWNVQRDALHLSDTGPELVRDYVVHTGAVAIIAMNQSDEICLIRQYRHPVGEDLWEIPAGLLDQPGEALVDAAQRELGEEADLRAHQWSVLVDEYPSPGSSTERIRIYLAEDLSSVPENERHVREEEEADIVSQWVPLSEATEAVLQGRIKNGCAVAGILAASAHRSGAAGAKTQSVGSA